MKKLLFGLLLCTVAMPASAANFSGKWTMQLPISFGSSKQTITLTLILNQVGNEVTGTLASTSPFPSGTGSPVGTDILDGKAEGSTISFYVWSGEDQPGKRYYKGTLAGEEIAFTAMGGPTGPSFGEASGPQQLKAKRSK